MKAFFIKVLSTAILVGFYSYLLSLLAWKRWLGLRGLINPSLNMQNDAKSNKTIPKSIQLQFKMLILLRGLFYKDDLFEGWMNRLNKDFLNYANKVDLPIQEPQKIDTLDWNTLDKDKFYQNYIINSKPVVIKNFPIQKDIWTIESLVDKCGDELATIADLETHLYDEMTLKQMIEKNLTGRRLYLRFLSCLNLFQKNPFFKTSLNLDQLETLAKRKIKYAGLFIGTKNNSWTPMHCENHLSFYFQLQGKKEWTLVDPDYSFLLKPSLSKMMLYVGGFTHENIDMFKFCPVEQVILEEGDFLIVPCWWWHLIRTVDDHNVSVSCRIGEGAFSCYSRNLKNKLDMPDLNHIFSSLQILNINLFKHTFNVILTRLTSMLSGDTRERLMLAEISERDVKYRDDVNNHISNLSQK